MRYYCFYEKKINLVSINIVNLLCILLSLFSVVYHETILASMTFDLHRENNIPSNALLHIHQARLINGLPLLTYSEILTKAAQAHSHYMAIHAICAHEETRNQDHFSGSDRNERAATARYPAPQYLAENISCSSQSSWKSSIDSLMVAIYHRFNFLSYTKNEIGYGHQKNILTYDQSPNKFTYLMGNSHVRKWCQFHENSTPFFNSTPSSPLIRHGLCLTAQQTMSKDQFVHATGLKQLPDIVMYPWNYQTNVFLAFFDDEVPDPTPSLTLSGNPISVQFNTYKFNEVEIIKFELIDENNRPVKVWHLNKDTDQNHLLSQYEHAWFPIQALDYNMKYTAVLDYRADSIIQQKKWSFTTQPHKKSGIIWSITKNEEVLTLPKGKSSIIRWHGNATKLSKVACYCTACHINVETFDTFSIMPKKNETIRCELHGQNQQAVTISIKATTFLNPHTYHRK